MSHKKREMIAGYIFIAPNFIGFAVFFVFPIIFSFCIGFFDWNLLGTPEFTGFLNYRNLFNDPLFWKTIFNTVYFSLGSVSLSVFIALFLASLLTGKIRFVKFIRSAIFLPTVFSVVAIALIWQWLLSYEMGYINIFLMKVFNMKPIPFINSTQLAMLSIILVAVWKGIGYNMIIFLAALSTVPKELYEAADLDGANRWRKFWRITWPLISPATFFVVVTSIINSFQVFDITTVMTEGGPANATNTLVMLIYQHAFKNFRMGYASAVAYILFAIVFIITIFQTYISKKWVHS